MNYISAINIKTFEEIELKIIDTIWYNIFSNNCSIELWTVRMEIIHIKIRKLIIWTKVENKIESDLKRVLYKAIVELLH